ncbi:MAG: tetratricopeptide repeat protein [Armatimonadetes bacterium]|nr:tetratricopeptide repeat protein [Armatimonadota bacterium]
MRLLPPWTQGIPAIRPSWLSDSEDPVARYALGKTLLETGEVEKAESALSTAVRQMPGEAFFQLGLACAKAAAGAWKEAEAALREAERLAPANEDTRGALTALEQWRRAQS